MSAIGDRVKLVEAAVAKGAQGWAANASGGIAGTITANAILKATGPTTVGNSSLTDDGTTVGTSEYFRAQRHLAFGSDAHIDDDTVFGYGAFPIVCNLGETITDLTTPFQVIGLTNYLNLNSSGAASAAVYGSDFEIKTDPSDSHDYPGGLVTAYFSANHRGSGNLSGTVLDSINSFSSNDGLGTVDFARSVYCSVSNTGAGTIVNSYGVLTYPAVNQGAGHVSNAYGVWVGSGVNSGGGTVGLNSAVWIGKQAIATNDYAFWYDSDGVYRIKGDGVTAYYNPAFSPKYTPGGTNFERIVQQWNTNVAEIGLEAGGTGTLRGLRLIGDHVEFPTFLEITEIADPAAPAATKARLYTKDVGGKVALMARFPTGAVQQIAIEP